MSETLQSKSTQTPVRPPEIERAIRVVKKLTQREIVTHASIPSGSPHHIPSEVLVYLIRQDLLSETRRLIEELTRELLGRCERNMALTVTGFSEPTLTQVREEILERFTLMLFSPKTQPDWLEVRFHRSFKFIRIDVCRHFDRQDKTLVYGEEVDDREGDIADHTPSGALSQEEALLLKQALALLTTQERQIFLLHRQTGIPIAAKNERDTTITGLMGISERTVRTRLRSAEAKFATLKEKAT